MALLADQEKLGDQNRKLGLREKEVTFELLRDATAVGEGPWIDVRAHHYKGIQVIGNAALAGDAVSIEISNDGVTPSPASNAAAAGMNKGDWASVEDACNFIRAKVTAIGAGKVSVIGHGILES